MQHHNKDGPGRGRPTLLALALLAWIILISSSSMAQGVANSVCAECHTEVSDSFHKTPHGTYFSDEAGLKENSCETCHGSATAHIESGDPKDIVNPARAESSDGNELCLTCHNTNRLADWPTSHHSAGDISCAACHTIHGTGANSLKKSTPALCYDCHADVRAASMLPSHHPIAEGKLDCLDCHGAHGETGRMAMENTGRELCFSCHADKEGPFVFEHAPVMEDCSICHSPHGTVADNLLKQTEPTLCLSCHAMHFHASIEGVDGAFTDPMDRTRDGVSTPDGWKKGMLTKCTQCHTQIHGSDLPSQSVSTGGTGLTR
jgi:DmsE family decaheme c-type cytochrome